MSPFLKWAQNWLCHALGSEYFFEARLPNCIEGAVNISNCGFGFVFLNIVFLFDR